jgi:predicted Zn-dependent peptidase
MQALEHGQDKMKKHYYKDFGAPPPPGHPKDVQFPDYFETTLSNGLKLLVYERNDLPIVTVNLVTRGGSFWDGDEAGLASMTGELLTKGTPSRSASDIVEEIEFLGGSIVSGAGWDSNTAGISILSRYVERAFDVLADVVQNPSFPEEELDRLREQRIAFIMQKKADPSSLAMSQFQRSVFNGHPYAKPAEGTEESVRALTRESISAFHARHFLPNNSFIIVVGDASPGNLVPMVERLFGAWKPGVLPAASKVLPDEPKGIRVQVVDRPSAVQSSIVVGHVGIARAIPDYIPVYIMNTLLGGYFGSRLNLNLREDKGFTYGAFSNFDARLDPGPFTAGADVRNEATEHAIDEIIKEIESIATLPVTGDELDNVKSYITGNFPIRIETPAQVARNITALELYKLDKSYYNTFNSNVLALTTDDILKAAQKWLHPDRLVIVAAGRGALLRTTLARFGTVEVFDADGALIPNV